MVCRKATLAVIFEKEKAIFAIWKGTFGAGFFSRAISTKIGRNSSLTACSALSRRGAIRVRGVNQGPGSAASCWHLSQKVNRVGCSIITVR